jgi:hypothetical protein
MKSVGTAPNPRRLLLVGVVLGIAVALILRQGSEGSSSDRPDRAAPAEVAGGGSLQQALDEAEDGDTIKVRGGPHPALRHDADHDPPVRIVGVGPDPPVVEGGLFAGATGLRFDGIEFAGPVLLRGDPVSGHRAPAADITFVRSEFHTDRTDVCLTVRDRAARIAVLRSRFHDCFTAIGGPGNLPTPPSRDISIRNNVIEDITSDGIQFGDWSRVEIVGNRISGLRDPAGVIHNDAIQFVGDSRDVEIRRNRLHDSNGQLLLIQDAYGPIADVDVTNNLLYGADAIAIQSQGAKNVAFRNNTVWRNGLGGLLLRPGTSGSNANGTVVANNILDSFALDEVDTRYRDYNLVGGADIPRSPHDIVGRSPRFVDRRAEDFRIRPSSPAAGTGSTRWAPDVDLRGRRRPAQPGLGAFRP